MTEFARKAFAVSLAAMAVFAVPDTSHAVEESLIDKFGFTGSSVVGQWIGEVCGRDASAFHPILFLPLSALSYSCRPHRIHLVRCGYRGFY